MTTDGNFKVCYKNKDIMDKLELIHKEISKSNIKIAETNARVSLHSKALYFLSGALISLAGWIIFIK